DFLLLLRNSFKSPSGSEGVGFCVVWTITILTGWFFLTSTGLSSLHGTASVKSTGKESGWQLCAQSMTQKTASETATKSNLLFIGHLAGWTFESQINEWREAPCSANCVRVP